MLFLAQTPPIDEAVDTINRLGNIEPFVVMGALSAVLVLIAVILVLYERNRLNSHTRFVEALLAENQRLSDDKAELETQVESERERRHNAEDELSDCNRRMFNYDELMRRYQRLRDYARGYEQLRKEYLALEDVVGILRRKHEPETVEMVQVDKPKSGVDTIPLPDLDEAGNWIIPSPIPMDEIEDDED